jgi:hypothetical protein
VGLFAPVADPLGVPAVWVPVGVPDVPVVPGGDDEADPAVVDWEVGPDVGPPVAADVGADVAPVLLSVGLAVGLEAGVGVGEEADPDGAADAVPVAVSDVDSDVVPALVSLVVAVGLDTDGGHVVHVGIPIGPVVVGMPVGLDALLLPLEVSLAGGLDVPEASPVVAGEVSPEDGVALDSAGGGALLVCGGGGALLVCGGGGALLDSAGGGVLLDSAGGGVLLDSAGGGVLLDSSPPGVEGLSSGVAEVEHVGSVTVPGAVGGQVGGGCPSSSAITYELPCASWNDAPTGRSLATLIGFFPDLRTSLPPGVPTYLHTKTLRWGAPLAETAVMSAAEITRHTQATHASTSAGTRLLLSDREAWFPRAMGASSRWHEPTSRTPRSYGEVHPRFPDRRPSSGPPTGA